MNVTNVINMHLIFILFLDSTWVFVYQASTDQTINIIYGRKLDLPPFFKVRKVLPVRAPSDLYLIGFAGCIDVIYSKDTLTTSNL